MKSMYPESISRSQSMQVTWDVIVRADYKIVIETSFDIRLNSFNVKKLSVTDDLKIRKH